MACASQVNQSVSGSMARSDSCSSFSSDLSDSLSPLATRHSPHLKKRGPFSPTIVLSNHISTQLVDVPPIQKPNNPGIAPALDSLLGAARQCRLPASQPSPAPGTSNYQTVTLFQSPNLDSRMQRANWCLNDFELGQKLYTGYSSAVYKAKCKASGERVALKIYALRKVCDLYKFQIYREVRLHSSLQHENILRLFAAFQEGDNVVMVTEYAAHGDLFNFMQKSGGRLSEAKAVTLVMEPFLRVLQYLHSKGIAHRDIKPENILLTKDMKLKIGDFGLAIDMGNERGVTRAGTLDYMPPEVLRCPFKAYPDENKNNTDLVYSSQHVDSWALGILVYEILVGFPPFYDQNRNGTEDRIREANPVFPDFMSHEAQNFVRSAVKKIPSDRPGVPDLMKHPWISKHCPQRQPTLMVAPLGPMKLGPVQQSCNAKVEECSKCEILASPSSPPDVPSLQVPEHMALPMQALTSQADDTTAVKPCASHPLSFATSLLANFSLGRLMSPLSLIKPQSSLEPHDAPGQPRLAAELSPSCELLPEDCQVVTGTAVVDPSVVGTAVVGTAPQLQTMLRSVGGACA